MEQEYSGGDFGSFEGEQVGGAFVAARAVFAGSVVPELIGDGLGEEIGFGRKNLSIKEFGFDGIVDAFDVGIGVRAGRRIKAVFGAEGLLDAQMKALGPIMESVAIELDAQVGGDDDLVGIQAGLLQVSKKSAGRPGWRRFWTVRCCKLRIERRRRVRGGCIGSEAGRCAASGARRRECR